MKAGGIAEPPGNDQDAPPTERHKNGWVGRASIARHIVSRPRAGGAVGAAARMNAARRPFMFMEFGKNAAVMMRT